MNTHIKKAADFARRNQKAILAAVLGVVLLVALYYMTQTVSTEGFKESEQYKHSKAKESFNDAVGGDVEYTTGDVKWDADKEVAVVFHRMPTCGPCKAFTPVWQKVSSGLRGKKDKSGRKIRLFVVDQHHTLSEDVNGFPTVRKHLSSEEHREFNGPRTEENLASFIMGV